jgi:RNA polymerase sigma-70 factor (family 1)
MTESFVHKDTLKEEEFNCTYTKYYTQLFYYAYGFVEDDEACRDILADVFERAWNNWEHVKSQTINSYLFSCVRNACIDNLRHDQAAQQYADYIKKGTDEEDDLSYEEREERLNAVKKAIEELPPKTRFVLEECYFNNKKYREVADTLQISSNAIKKHIMKAFSILREKLSVTNS